MHPPGDSGSGTVAGAAYIARRELEAFVRDAIESAGSLHAFAAGHTLAPLKGRGEAHVIDSPAGRLVVRHYRRGGAVASILDDRYARAGTPRPFRELRVSDNARARGIPTPAVAAAVVYPAGIFYRGDIATEYVPDSSTLADVTFGAAWRMHDERHRAWHTTGRLLRAAADSGLVHADLNLRNVLIAWRADEPVAYLLDLDRCRIVSRASSRDVGRMKARLERSARKMEAQTCQALSDELAALEEGLRG